MPAALKKLEQIFQVYFSYDPEVFVPDGRRSVSCGNCTVDDVLKILLQPYFTHSRFGDYVVINVLRGPPPAKKKTEIKARTITTVFDTVSVFRHIVIYDTQRVVVPVRVADTVRIKVVNVIRDSVAPQAAASGSGRFSLSASLYNWHSGPSEKWNNLAYSGYALGLQGKLLNRRLQILAGLGYHYLAQNFSYGVRIPGPDPAPDSLLTSPDSLLTSERINSLRLFSIEALGGIEGKIRNFTIVAQGGFVSFFPFSLDEKVTGYDGSVITVPSSALNGMLINAHIDLQVHVPLYKAGMVGVSPFFEAGLNPTYRRGSADGIRRRYGVRLIFAFD
ncbi:MAG TPA: hypothetical protein VGD40_02495 [Chryseosolibacter sp.]